MKEGQTTKLLRTPTALHPESQRLQQDLEKVEQLEGKITSEQSSLMERVSTMESELNTYRDLDTLRRSAEERKKVTDVQQHPTASSPWDRSCPSFEHTELNRCLWVQKLQEERVSLTQRQDSFKQLLEEMNRKYEALKSKLQENETHAQVRAFSHSAWEAVVYVTCSRTNCHFVVHTFIILLMSCVCLCVPAD